MISSPELKRLLVASVTNSTATGVSLTGAEISREIFVSRTLLRGARRFQQRDPQLVPPPPWAAAPLPARPAACQAALPQSSAAQILRLSIT